MVEVGKRSYANHAGRPNQIAQTFIAMLAAGAAEHPEYEAGIAEAIRLFKQGHPDTNPEAPRHLARSEQRSLDRALRKSVEIVKPKAGEEG